MAMRAAARVAAMTTASGDSIGREDGGQIRLARARATTKVAVRAAARAAAMATVSGDSRSSQKGCWVHAMG